MSAFRVNSNVTAMNANRNLANNATAFNKSMDRLASGRRIVSAADDAAGLAIANRLRADIRSFGVAERNVSEASSIIGIAEGASQNIEGILERLKELATQAASANADGQQAVIDDEFQAMIDEIDRIVDSTAYQGVDLIDGTYDGTFQVGPENEVHFQLDVDLTDVDLSAEGLGVDLLDLTNQANAQDALDTLDDAIDDVNSALGELGAYQNRLDTAADNIRTSIINLQGSESVIRDVDFASEMTEYSKGQVLQQVGAAMLASANASGQTVLSLL